MGKGDLRTKKGKIANGSYGNSRKHKQKSEVKFEAKPATAKKAKGENTLEDIVADGDAKGAKATKKTAKATKKTTK